MPCFEDWEAYTIHLCVWVVHTYVFITHYSVWHTVGTQKVVLERIKVFMVVIKMVQWIRVIGGAGGVGGAGGGCADGGSHGDEERLWWWKQ